MTRIRTSTTNQFGLRRVSIKDSRAFLAQHHYAKGCSNAAMSWGMYDEHNELMALAVIANPCSEAVKSVVFGEDEKDRVRELHRLARRPDFTMPLSQFHALVVKSLLEYRPQIRALISFSDLTEGHHGGIYQACNYLFTGSTARARFYRDPHGVLRHPRQNGVNIDAETARSRGWAIEMREAKFRYVAAVGPTASERRKWRKRILLESLPYPKPDQP